MSEKTVNRVRDDKSECHLYYSSRQSWKVYRERPMGLLTVHSTMRCTSHPVLKGSRKLQLLLPQCRGHAPEKSMAQKSRTDCALTPKRLKRSELLCQNSAIRWVDAVSCPEVGEGMEKGPGVFPCYSFLWMEGNQEAKELKWVTNKDLLYSTWDSLVLCGNLDGRGVWERMDSCI